MNSRVVHCAWLISLALTCVACDPAANKLSQEQAINRGDAPVAQVQASADSAFKASCARALGQWQASTKLCAMTAPMCHEPGEWNETIGCVFPTITAADCRDMQNQGMHMVGAACAITELTGDQLEQLGLDGDQS